MIGNPELRVERARTDVESSAYGGLEQLQRVAAQGTISVNDHVLALPFRGRRGAIGTLLLGTAESAAPFGPNEITSAETLANRVAIALDYALLMEHRGLDAAAKMRDQSTSDAAGGRLWQIMNHLSDIILILDTSGAIKYANTAVWLGLGCRPEELIGCEFLELIAFEG